MSKSAKETIITLSTMKIEFVACFGVVVHVLWLQKIILWIGFVDFIVKSLRIYCACINFLLSKMTSILMVFTAHNENVAH